MKEIRGWAWMGVAAALGGFATPAWADLSAGSCTDAQTARISSEHTTQIGGKTIAYTAVIGFLEVTAADQSSKACVFYTAYFVHPAPGDSAPRPITFAFNGGPGSASLWLHLGLLGPKRVDMGPDGLTPPQGTGLIVNDDSPLDVTDVVMIDPVATGFSQTEDQASNNEFFGVTNDYTSIEAFIDNFLITYDRWASPKFILGESYGGIRGSLLANHLQSDLGIAVTGIILISPALSTLPLYGDPDDLVPYWTFFPTLATTAWFHKMIAPQYQSLEVADVYTQAKAFADNQYRDALDLGDGVDPKELGLITDQVAGFTGFPASYVQNLALRVDESSDFNDLLSASDLWIGRYDSRFTALKVAGQPASDPSYTAVSLPYTAAINEYLRAELGFDLPLPYNDFADVTSWPGDASGGAFPDVMTDLASALSANPNLHIMIASGYFDLACPMGTVDYEVSQLPGGAALASRIEQKRYVGGHMMYINPVALQQLKADIASFIHP